MNHRTLLAAASFLALLSGLAGAQTKAPADSALAARVRAQLVRQLGAERAARVTVTANAGAVQIVAPELSTSQRDAVVRGVRSVAGVKSVRAVVGTVTRPPSAAVIGEKGKKPAGSAAVIGEKGKAPVVTAGVIGEKSKVRTSTVGVIGEKSKVRTSTVGVIGEKAKVRSADAALADAARARLVARLGAAAASQLHVSARDGVVTVHPVETAKPNALQVTKALEGLEGMRRLENHVTP